MNDLMFFCYQTDLILCFKKYSRKNQRKILCPKAKNQFALM